MQQYLPPYVRLLLENLPARSFFPSNQNCNVHRVSGSVDALHRRHASGGPGRPELKRHPNFLLPHVRIIWPRQRGLFFKFSSCGPRRARPHGHVHVHVWGFLVHQDSVTSLCRCPSPRARRRRAYVWWNETETGGARWKRPLPLNCSVSRFPRLP